MTDVSETEAIVGDASIVPEPEGADLPEGLVDSIELTEEVAEEIVEAEEKPLPRPFVPLHVHTHYSLLDGATRVKDIIAIAKESNMPAAAITDHGVMYGAVEFYNGAKAAGIKPIIGCDMYVTDGDITDRTARKPNFGLVLLAKDLVGYKNLVKMVSTSHLEGFYYKPRINWEILKTHSQGLIALSGDLAGPIGYYVMRGNMEAARERARSLKDIFGDDFYLEIFDHGKETETRFTLESLKISQELGIELVITNDSHFSRPGDQEMQKILLCMQTGKTLEENTRVQEIYGPEYYLKNGDELAERFAFLDPVVKEHALDNTLVVAEKCNLELEQGVSILPEFPLPEGQTPEEALLEVVNDHARQRYGEITPEIRQRLDYELGIINQMGFPAYFLITWDFINYARKNDIPVGPGRGSAAGSLVAFCLGITNIDPLEHNLLFERFLNPERVSMPDIDIDFCIERRDEVIQYVAQRYGRERVCQIGTFGTLAARAAVKAVARVMSYPFADSDRLAKMIPAVPGTKLADAMKEGMELKAAYDKDPQVKEIVDLALSIEGNAFNVGTHAAGVVISKDPLMDVVPLQLSKDGQMISQYPMGDLENLGLLKMDFLGLRNLTIINNTLRLVQQGKGDSLDMDQLPLDDEAVYQLLSSGDTDGVFQLESGGMKALVKDLRPTTFEDINALVALFRPGPLNSGMVKDFVNRKHGREQVVFKHPDLEPVLKDTYGTIVYQEQIMQIAQVLGGYSLGQADLLRRAMGKKKAEVMAKERDGFIKGATDNGVSDTLANELFDTMSEFAAYCFNRSHSAAYAMVAYQTAFLKTHYPVEYLSALLSSVRNDLDKIQLYILTARDMNVKVLPPDIVTSGSDFTPDGDAIRFGLASVKNVGTGVVEMIVKAREEKSFTSLEDFCQRVDPKVLNRKTLESLVLCGALSSFGISRKQLFHNVESIIQFANRCHEQKLSGQVSLFDALAASGGDGDEVGFSGLVLSGSPEEYTDEETQQYEKSLLGFYVSSHPLDSLVDQLPLVVSHLITELPAQEDGIEVTIGGLLSSFQRKMTRSNKPMGIGILEDLTGGVEFVTFSETLEANQELLQPGAKICIQGRLQFRGDDSKTHSVVMNEVRLLKTVQPLNLFFEVMPRYEDVEYLRRMLAESKGPNPVILNFKDGTKIKTGPQFWVSDERDSISSRLLQHFGEWLRVG